MERQLFLLLAMDTSPRDIEPLVSDLLLLLLVLVPLEALLASMDWTV